MPEELSAPDFRQIFAAAPSPCLVLAPDLTIVDANAAYLRVTLRSREDLIGRSLFEAFPDNPDDPQASGVRNLRASLERVLAARALDTMPVQKYDIRRPAEQGGGFEERYWSPVNSPVLDDDGGVAYILHRVEDVTDFVRMQGRLAPDAGDAEASRRRIEELETEMFQRSRERLEANLRLREANAAMAALDRAKTTFFSNISHELRTPLTLMLAPLEDLLQGAGGFDESQREALALAHRNALRLLKLVNAVLDLTRVEVGSAAASYEPTDLADFTRELADVFRSAVERAGLRFIVDCPPLPETVYVDRGMWEKIVLNLVSNALKYTFDGEIEVSLHARDAQAELTVRDTGSGIAAAELPHLFERFHRVAGARGRTQEGAGIGLALVYELVGIHAGTVRVDSVPDQGSRFVVGIPFGSAHLPAERVFAGQPHAVPSSAGLYADEALSWLPRESPPATTIPAVPASAPLRRRILLAEDNADLRGYLARLLGSHYHVEAVADGQAALAVATRRPPDLVVTDIMMPKLNGVDLVRAIRANPRSRTLPIIILSASATEEARIAGIEAGADDYLIKPFSVRELLARVAGQLAQAEHVRREQALRAEAEAMKSHLQMLIESVRDAFVAVDRHWRITFVNAKAAQEASRPVDKVLGTDVWSTFQLSQIDPVRNMLEQAMRERRPASMEYRYAPTGRWWEVRAFPSPEGLVIFSTDVSERKLASDRLQEMQECLSAAAEIANLGFWEWWPGDDRVVLSREWKRQLGYDEHELAERIDTWLTRLHADDRDRVLAEIAGMHVDTTHAYETEYRLRHRNGDYRWISARFRPVAEVQGRIERLVITHLDVTNAKEAERQARLSAQHDPLTDLPNRALLCEHAEHLIAAARRSGRSLAVLFVDLDRFKPINDTYGHQVGDQLLGELARRLTKSVRAEDVVGRLGGDEFLAVMQTHDERDAARIAGHVLQFITQPYEIGGLALSIGASIGISLFPRDGNDIETLIQNADTAMYGAKEGGRDRFRFFTADMERQARAALDIEVLLRQALQTKDFSLYYQAVVNPRTGAVNGAEALLRWPQPDGSFIAPDVFLPIAETAGLMQPLGEWVFEEVARQQRAWLAAGLPALSIAVNVSALQLRHRGFLAHLRRLLADWPVGPEMLMLEVPESALGGSVGESEELLRPLKGLGLQLAVGNLGSGAASLSNLSSLPIDKFKLAPPFVLPLPAGLASPAFVEMVLAMGHSLHHDVIAVGIETQEALEFIRSRNCDLAQGFFLCPPLPAADFGEWLGQRMVA